MILHAEAGHTLFNSDIKIENVIREKIKHLDNVY